MISRVTIFSLLLGLMLGIGIRMWSDAHSDACAAFLAGEPRAPASEWVSSGTRLISVPCSDWIMRQPLRVQVLCLLDLALGLVFVLNALADLRGWLQMRQRARRGAGPESPRE